MPAHNHPLASSHGVHEVGIKGVIVQVCSDDNFVSDAGVAADALTGGGKGTNRIHERTVAVVVWDGAHPFFAILFLKSPQDMLSIG